MKTKRLSLKDFKAKSTKDQSKEALAKVTGGFFSDCHL